MWLYRLNHFLAPTLGLYWRLGLRGAVEAIPPTGPAIVASNHASRLDPWFLGMAFPRLIRYLVAPHWYYRSPVWSAMFRAFGAEPVRAGRPLATVDAVCRILARGEVVGIFPEGHVSADGQLRRFRSGLSWMAARSGAPVIPVGIRGSFRSLPKGRHAPKPARVTVHVGHPLLYPGAPSHEVPTPEASQAFQAQVLGEVCTLAEAAGPRSNPAGSMPTTPARSIDWSARALDLDTDR